MTLYCSRQKKSALWAEDEGSRGRRETKNGKRRKTEKESMQNGQAAGRERKRKGKSEGESKCLCGGSFERDFPLHSWWTFFVGSSSASSSASSLSLFLLFFSLSFSSLYISRSVSLSVFRSVYIYMPSNPLSISCNPLSIFNYLLRYLVSLFICLLLYFFHLSLYPYLCIFVYQSVYLYILIYLYLYWCVYIHVSLLPFATVNFPYFTYHVFSIFIAFHFSFHSFLPSLFPLFTVLFSSFPPLHPSAPFHFFLFLSFHFSQFPRQVFFPPSLRVFISHLSSSSAFTHPPFCSLADHFQPVFSPWTLAARSPLGSPLEPPRNLRSSLSHSSLI